MDISDEKILTNSEKEILQEIMNIGFGAASADLAEIIDVHVILSVPTILVLSPSELLSYIVSEVGPAKDLSIIEQNFHSKFSGMAMLVFSTGSGKDFLFMLRKENATDLFESESIEQFEKEVLKEVGNTLISACVGKISELLGDFATYSPPNVLTGRLADSGFSKNILDPANVVIMLQTCFNFSGKNLKGYLFLITSHDSIDWLRQSIHLFMKQYE